MWHSREYFYIVRQQSILRKKILQTFHILAQVGYSRENKNAQNFLEVSPHLKFNIHQSLLSLYNFYYSES